MGSVFGKINEETPSFTSLGNIGDLEVRQYEDQYIATVKSSDFPDVKTRTQFNGVAFRLLAKYIGVFSKPANTSRDGEQKPEAVSMTAPVVMRTSEALETEKAEPLAMTAPVILGGNESEKVDWTMSFILPSKYIKNQKFPPYPKDNRITISRRPGRMVAVKTFSNILTMERVDKMAAEAIETIKNNTTTREIVTTKDGSPSWEAMGYNSPFVLPCYRTNEIAVLLKDKEDIKSV